MLRAVVAAFVAGDYGLACGVEGVARPSDSVASRIADNVADYGEALVELPDATWRSSLAQRVSNDRCDVLVDLWTAESGRSDLVLDGWFDTSLAPVRLNIHLVYVP